MSQCVVPNWELRHQRQEKQVEGEGNNRSSHVHSHSHSQDQHLSHLVPMSIQPKMGFLSRSNYEVAELTWENGQLAMHGLGGLLPPAPTKPTWGRSNDTLESIVHQATYHKQNLNVHQHDNQTPANISSMVASSGGKLSESSGQVPKVPGLLKKRTRLDSDQCGRNFNGSSQEERADRSTCASASATFCRDNDTTLMTWASYESPRSLKTSKTADEDSASHGGSENRDDEDRKTGGEIGRSPLSTRRRRAAAIHNQSERRRRDRINQKINALQKLVPNASKTDKASMLDEVIEYLKQLQAQVQMLSMRTPQMMMHLGMQQNLQMSLLARMGMGVGLGMGMGMLDINTMARNSSQSLPSLIHPTSLAASPHTFVPPPFVVPPMIPMRTPAQANQDPRTNSPVPLPDPYCALLAQSMNIDLYNKMAAALYRQQVNQTNQASSSPSQSNHVQGEYEEKLHAY